MKHTFEYNGYYGSAEVSIEDNLLHGRLLFIKDVISYAAYTPNELEQAFKSAVDDYLATCAELGDAPDTPFKGVFNVRLTPDLHRDCALAALQDEVTLNDWVKAACKSRLAHQNIEIHHHQHNHLHETKLILRNEETIALPEIDYSQYGLREESWQPSQH